MFWINWRPEGGLQAKFELLKTLWRGKGTWWHQRGKRVKDACSWKPTTVAHFLVLCLGKGPTPSVLFTHKLAWTISVSFFFFLTWQVLMKFALPSHFRFPVTFFLFWNCYLQVWKGWRTEGGHMGEKVHARVGSSSSQESFFFPSSSNSGFHELRNISASAECRSPTQKLRVSIVNRSMMHDAPSCNSFVCYIQKHSEIKSPFNYFYIALVGPFSWTWPCYVDDGPETSFSIALVITTNDRNTGPKLR